MAVRIGKDNFTEKVLENALPVVVDFYSDTCIACKRLSPVLGAAQEELEKRVSFYKVNTDFEKELTRTYGIMSLPTLLLFQGGKEQSRKSGALSLAELKSWLESNFE